GSLGALVAAMESLGDAAGVVWAASFGALSLAGSAALVLHTRRVENPLLRLDLLRRPVLRLSMLCDLMTRMVIGSAAMLLSLMFQVGLNRTALGAGALLLLPGLGQLALKPIIATGSRTLGIAWTMTLGAIATSACFAAIALWPTM